MRESKEFTQIISENGTDAVSEGKLTGTTDTDFFYFLCPKCNDGGTEIMRIINVAEANDLKFDYDIKPKPKKLIHLCFELYCDKCKTHTAVKLTNCGGWQGGSITDPSFHFQHKVIGANEPV